MSVKIENQDQTDSKKYSKKTDREHVLDLPGMYISSIDPSDQEAWVTSHIDLTQIDTIKMVWRTLKFTPGFYKIFDEVLQNAADHVVRTRLLSLKDSEVKKTTQIKITFEDDGRISVWNNGDGIPVVEHTEHKILIPSMIFGELRTSGNYDKNEKRTVGGMNGAGSKLTNIFSTEFIVETVDRVRQKKFIQRWTDNMSLAYPAKVTSFSGAPYTRISFMPDYKRFGMNGLDDAIRSLLYRRAFDVAATAGCTVFINGAKLPVHDFFKYIDLYLNTDEDHDKNEELNDDADINMSTDTDEKSATRTRSKLIQETIYQPHQPGEIAWQIAVLESPSNEHKHCSFVNNISTYDGGKHVEWVCNKICKYVTDQINAKRKSNQSELQLRHVRNNMFLFINCYIENPTFTSQTKTSLSSSVTTFFPLNLSDTFLKKVMKSDIVTRALATKDFQEEKLLIKAENIGKKQRYVNVPKLEDALWAGTSKSTETCLLVTEGDSARSFALSARTDNYRFGVYPIRGKFVNVRNMTTSQMLKEQQGDAKSGMKEVMELSKILGITSNPNLKREDLRYYSLGLLCDQDSDGAHIKGLLLNWIAVKNPKLLEQGFVINYNTPLIKVKNRQNQVVAVFYNQADFEQWRKDKDLDREHLKPTWYKGLGTSSASEAREYFTSPKKSIFRCDAMGLEMLNMAFHKKLADQRKHWIAKYNGDTLNYNDNDISVTDFINKELIIHSIENAMRTIPSVMDGLKPVQRKIATMMLKLYDSTKTRNEDHKVSSLQGAVTKHMAYHHGNQPLEEAIIQLAQDFTGSNNINLLQPNGQFGTILKNGADAAQSRYVLTKADPVMRAIFRPEDDALLTYCFDDGKRVEPEWYLPILPFVLVNGVNGIGTGFSTLVSSYNPLDLIQNQRRFLSQQPMQPLTPWFRGFKGHVVPGAKPHHWVIKGLWRRLPDQLNSTQNNEPIYSIEITALPVGTSTESYKYFLQDLLDQCHAGVKEEKSDLSLSKKKGLKGKAGDKKKEFPFTKLMIDPADDHNPCFNVHWTISWTGRQLTDGDIEDWFQLKTTVAETNLHVYDPLHHLCKFPCALALQEAFCRFRLQYYELRRRRLIQEKKRELFVLEQKNRYIEEILLGKIVIWKKKKMEVIQQLVDHKFVKADDLPELTREFLPTSAWKEASENFVVHDSSIYSRMYKQQWIGSNGANNVKIEELNEDEDQPMDQHMSDAGAHSVSAYRHLTGISHFNMTQDDIDELQQQMRKTKEAIEQLNRIKAADIWIQDMNEFEVAYNDHMKRYQLNNQQGVSMRPTNAAIKGKNQKKKVF